MALTSTFILGAIQVDGRRYVTETHTDGFNQTYVFTYLASVGDDFDAVLAARKAAIAAQQPDEECARIVNQLLPGAIVLHYATAAQLAAYFRAVYLGSSQEQCARLATWLLDKIDAGFITPAIVRTAFGINVTQYNTLYAKLNTLRGDWMAVLAAQGE
jgi:hypothetical protein